MYKIMLAALELFSKNGYVRTGVRQIADECGISLGLVNHYYTSKRLLAQEALALIQEYLSRAAWAHADVETSPLLFDAILTRLQMQYFLQGPLKQFYLDALQDGIFFDTVAQWPYRALVRLRRLYPAPGGSIPLPDNDDYMLLFNRYLPCDLEKILVLQKEAGNLSSIPYDDIPYLICRTALERFVPVEEIMQADQASREITPGILAALLPTPPEDFVLAYIHYRCPAQ